jgi:hypothetical protein
VKVRDLIDLYADRIPLGQSDYHLKRFAGMHIFDGAVLEMGSGGGRNFKRMALLRQNEGLGDDLGERFGNLG